MLTPIVLVSVVLSVLAGQVGAQSPLTGATAPVRDVTKAPRAAEIEFVDFEFQQPRPMHGGVALFGIDGEPASGTRYPVEASIGGEAGIASASFEVIADDGTIIQPLRIAWRGTAAPGHSNFIGVMHVPSRPFRILLTGQTVDGRRFRLVYERLFKPVKGTVDLRPAGEIPPEYGGQRRLMDEEAARLVAEAEAYAAAHATDPLVMPRMAVSNVRYAPLLSAAGRPIGVRLTYDVELSQDGQYNPRLDVHPEDLEDSSGVSAEMRVLNSSLEPLPRLAHAPQAPADTRGGDSVLAYGADFLYDARTVYHFRVDLVPGFIATGGGASTPCIWRQGFQTAPNPDKAFARMLAGEGPKTYRVYIGGETFEGRIENLSGEGTLYRSFVAEGAPDCAQPAR
jgi:hypothetical protein